MWPASPRDRLALAPDGERYTAFTGELLRVLRAGVPAGPVLAGDVRAALVATGLTLARLPRAEGNIRDALPVLRLALREQVSEGRGELLAVQLELSELLAEPGQLREAVEVLEPAFQHVHKVYGPEAVLVCRRLADLLQESGNHTPSTSRSTGAWAAPA
ncbi:hypothetical protein ABZ929_18740 [Streptomyces physcomitrii]|uniref:hypothetical protein n=1 Tax=Streptomyces physcomitrii TaxID=2724184 RepID=UPI00341E5855